MINFLQLKLVYNFHLTDIERKRIFKREKEQVCRGFRLTLIVSLLKDKP